MSTVSVVIALYNKQKYIAACIDSVLKQSFSDFELIIVDDGSTDASLDIVNEIKDQRITIVTQSNLGPGVARNKGVALSTSSLLAFIDADDVWNPLFLETAIMHLTAKDVSVFVCGANWEPLGDRRLPVLPSEGEFVKSGLWQLPTTLSSTELNTAMNFFATGAVMIKKEIFTKYGGFFDRIRCNSGEDAYLWIQVMFNHVIYRELSCLLTVNTEGSELGIGRRTLKPIPPSLLDTAALRKQCSIAYSPSLNRLLCYIAFRAFRREVYQLHFSKAIRLWIKFPALAQERPNDFPPIFLSFFIIPFQKYVSKLRRHISVIYI